MRPLINVFRGEHRFLSNFYKLKKPVVFEGMKYDTVECAYVSSKTVHAGTRYRVSLMNPSVAKKFGDGIFKNSISPNPKWSDEYRIEVMTDLVRQKFKKNPDLAEKLIATKDAELIEGNYWHNNFFGVCFCGHCPKEKRRPPEQRNNLGKILEKVREELVREKEGN